MLVTFLDLRAMMLCDLQSFHPTMFQLATPALRRPGRPRHTWIFLGSTSVWTCFGKDPSEFMANPVQINVLYNPAVQTLILGQVPEIFLILCHFYLAIPAECVVALVRITFYSLDCVYPRFVSPCPRAPTTRQYLA